MSLDRRTKPRVALTPEQSRQVEANMGLVGYVANRRQVRPSEWQDAFQDGTLGLIRAAQLFEPAKGFQFSTYAVTWINSAMGRGRERWLGVNYRRDPEAFKTPLSIDIESDAVDGPPPIQIASTDAPPEEPATAAALVAELADLLASWDLDRADRVIADELLKPNIDTHWNSRDDSVAKAVGLSREMIRQRRHKIQRRLKQARYDVWREL